MNLTLDQLLAADGPVCLIIKAQFEPVGDTDRFQPAGFPEMGHVIYDAPRVDEKGNPTPAEKVCIVDSAASMANHLETVCFSNPAAGILHTDLAGLPYVRCVTDDKNGGKTRVVMSTLAEGHRLASEYFIQNDSKKGVVTFLKGTNQGRPVRTVLHEELGIEIIPKLKKSKVKAPGSAIKSAPETSVDEKREVSADFTAFITPDDWWKVYTTIFKLDPNSLIHGVFFAKEQIKITRILTAHLEAFGAARVGSAGVKFDRLNKTNSGQPIFAKDEETARRIEAAFVIDLGLLRSYGNGDRGLSTIQKRLLLELALWKIQRMLGAPFRFRSGCHLRCVSRGYTTDNGAVLDEAGFGMNLRAAIGACAFGPYAVTDVYYPRKDLFNPKNVPAETSESSDQPEGEGENAPEENETDTQQE